MASKACHPNECFDTILCNGIFPVTRPFFIFSPLSECFAIVLCKSVFATRQSAWQMQVSDTIMDQSTMIVLGVLLLCYATMPLPSAVSEAGTDARKNGINIELLYSQFIS